MMAEEVPIGQSMQVELEVAPNSDENVPGGHGLHLTTVAVPLMSEYVPGGHIWQEEPPTVL